MSQKARRVSLCTSGAATVQCGYCSYVGGYEAHRKGIPTHVHKDALGHFEALVYGPLEKCTRERGRR